MRITPIIIERTEGESQRKTKINLKEQNQRNLENG